MNALDLVLTATVTAPGVARAAVRTWLSKRRCNQDVVDNAALLVSELVTNAVLYGAGRGPRLTLEEVAQDVIRVTVHDHSDDLPRRQNGVPNEEKPGGRGLFLVESFASAWGWEPRRAGKRIWFELDCPVSTEKRG